MELDKKTKIKFNVLAIVCIIIFCIALTPVTLQNDTYYTIKIGEDIIKNGVSNVDQFSWHEDLAYTPPHLGYDVATYLIYNVRWIYRYIHCNSGAYSHTRLSNVFNKYKINKK